VNRLAFALVLFCTLARAQAGTLHSDGGLLRDAQNRVVFFHGVNAVWKKKPYYPPSAVYPTDPAALDASYFDARDGAFLAANGLNAVRLGVLWAGEEAAASQPDASYLDHIEAIVDMLAAHGIAVLLDFHQDMYNEKYAGQGFPDWATIDDGVPNAPVFGFPGNYFLDPALFHAFDNLWLDRDGLWAKYGAFWARVAERFKDKPNLLGYDLLNEPWAGAQWPTCLNPIGCPQFDVLFLQRFHESAIAAVREVDAQSPVWWEPQVIDDGGAGNNVGLLSPIADPGANQGISFHVYSLATLFGSAAPNVLSGPNDPVSALNEDLVFRQQQLAAARNRSALLLSEFGASDSLDDIGRVTALSDQYLVSWTYWAYGGWGDPTGNALQEGLFTDDLQRFDAGGNPQGLKAKADLLIRTFPRAIAGTPRSFAFDPASKQFTLAYDADCSIDAPTEIFVPVARHYGGHYTASVSGPASVTSASDAAVLTLQNTGAGLVEITVTRSP
jgi:endoglycosylceramidase